MSLAIVETQYDEPLTFDRMNEEEDRLVPCLADRYAIWRYSLLSDDRCRTICTYEARDAESVRVAHHKAKVFFSRIWAGEILEPENDQPQPLINPRIVMEATYSALSQEEWSEIQHQLLHCYSEQGIEWLRAYLSLDRTTAVWELQAPNVESVQAAHQKGKIACDRIWSAKLLNPEIWAELVFSGTRDLHL
jgi:hypothetical protein